MIKKLTLTVCFVFIASQLAAQDGYKSMFNGKDLSGWKGNPDLWSVEDGAITGTTSADKPIKFNTFLVWQDGEPSNFELICKFKITSKGNSGIQYRSRVIDADKFIIGGYQADIDGSGRFAGICYEEKGDGILCGRGESSAVHSKKEMKKTKIGDAKKLGEQIKSEDWNDYKIVAKGNHLQHYINGTLMSEVFDHRPDNKSSSSGVIALQIHVGPPMKIQYKDMKIKNL